jgi:hypothetical protein
VKTLQRSLHMLAAIVALLVVLLAILLVVALLCFQQALLFLLGILAGGIAYGLVEVIKLWVTRSRLMLSFDEDKGCRVLTRAAVTIRKTGGADERLSTEAYYVRIMAQNRSWWRRPARNCRAYLSHLVFKEEGTGWSIELPDMIPLSWSYSQ